jgi:putative oxidoreductase
MEILLHLIKTDGEWVVTAVRIVLGIVLFAHGAQKLLGWYGGAGFANSVQMLTTYVKLPKAVAVVVIFTEFLGGLGLILGFLSRLAALGILATMVGAIVTVHYANGLFMNWAGEKKGHGFEYHLLAIALALVVVVRGAGAFSLDRAFYQHQIDKRTAAIETSRAFPRFQRRAEDLVSATFE